MNPRPPLDRGVALPGDHFHHPLQALPGEVKPQPVRPRGAPRAGHARRRRHGRVAQREPRVRTLQRGQRERRRGKLDAAVVVPAGVEVKGSQAGARLREHRRVVRVTKRRPRHAAANRADRRFVVGGIDPRKDQARRDRPFLVADTPDGGESRPVPDHPHPQQPDVHVDVGGEASAVGGHALQPAVHRLHPRRAGGVADRRPRYPAPRAGRRVDLVAQRDLHA
jgi:hypothetical protein